MPLGWPIGRPLSPMCCYAQPNRVPDYLYLWGANAGNVSGAPGFMGKATTSTGSALTNARTTAFYDGGTVDPFLMMGSWQLVDIKVVCAGCAVAQATVGADPRLQLLLVQVNHDSYTTIATLNLPCISGIGSIGINDVATGRTGLIYFAQHTFSPPIKPAPFTFFGFHFVNQNADNNKINDIQVTECALVFKGHF